MRRRPGAVSVDELEGYLIMATKPSGIPDFGHSSKIIKSPKGIKSRIVGVGKMVVSQRCELLSSLVITAKDQVTK